MADKTLKETRDVIETLHQSGVKSATIAKKLGLTHEYVQTYLKGFNTAVETAHAMGYEEKATP